MIDEFQFKNVTNKKIECPYCGTINEADKTECQECGVCLNAEGNF